MGIGLYAHVYTQCLMHNSRITQSTYITNLLVKHFEEFNLWISPLTEADKHYLSHTHTHTHAYTCTCVHTYMYIHTYPCRPPLTGRIGTCVAGFFGANGVEDRLGPELLISASDGGNFPLLLLPSLGWNCSSVSLLDCSLSSVLLQAHMEGGEGESHFQCKER